MKQMIIFISGVMAIGLTQSGNAELQRYACFAGLVGQPFWIHSTYQSRQWGMLGLTLAYTGAWLFGLYNFWIKG